MKLTKLSYAFLAFTAAMLLIAGMLLRGAAQTKPQAARIIGTAAERYISGK
jgi:hypothetical protein